MGFAVVIAVPSGILGCSVLVSGLVEGEWGVGFCLALGLLRPNNALHLTPVVGFLRFIEPLHRRR